MQRRQRHWADPRQTHAAEINHHGGSCGVYFHDPSDHYLEIITRSHGSSG